MQRGTTLHLARVQIANFRNFSKFDVALVPNTVVVGANRIGKSNFLLALRLVLDVSLPDSARQLKLADFWDGCALKDSPAIRIDLDFADFDSDPALLALLTDYRLPTDYQLARLSYIFRKRADVTAPPTSDADYEFKIFGGDDEARGVRSDVRRRICLDLLHALRDAESDLSNWRASPIRPLLEDAIGQVAEGDLTAIAKDVTEATSKLGALVPVAELESRLRKDIADLSGASQDIKTKFGFAPSDALRLFRSIALLIDDGKRGIADASLGSANVALLALKLAEFSWRRRKNERNFSLLCIEEPEAHLHPHLQRSVFQKLLSPATTEPRGLILTTHSPQIASITPLKSVVLLKSTPEQGTKGHSLANLPVDPVEAEDLQRYLNATRAELLFSRGVIFVEGDAEAALIPVFANTLGHDLDSKGISVVNVGGVNFRPYVKLATALALPKSIITDWDPLDGTKPPLGRARILDLADDIRSINGRPPISPTDRKNLEVDDDLLRASAMKAGMFVNHSTFEIEIAQTPALSAPLLEIMAEAGFGPLRKRRLASWKVNPASIDAEQLLAMVADIGKGRLAGRLADRSLGLPPPQYIKDAIEHVIGHV